MQVQCSHTSMCLVGIGPQLVVNSNDVLIQGNIRAADIKNYVNIGIAGGQRGLNPAPIIC